MSAEKFIILLSICSTLTGFTVEGIKKLLDERNKTYYSNTLAAITSICLATALSIGYGILYDVQMDKHYVICAIALMFTSWLCSMVGYDKVIQTIAQFRNNSSKEE